VGDGELDQAAVVKIFYGHTRPRRTSVIARVDI
jgi:hypothetical protein